MNQLEIINAYVPTIALVIATIFGYMFLKNQKNSGNKNNVVIDNNVEKNETDLGGYVVVDVPEDRKSLFQDLLKGFEEYSLAKGYKVSISIDSSVEGKFAFKFTIIEYGITTSPKQVKRDLDEYIEKIKRGENFDDLMDIAESVEVQKVIMALRNRVSFLQQNYQVEKNIKEFYESFVHRMSMNSISHLPPTVQINQGAIEMESKNYSANNSANVMQGDNHSNTLETGNINIGSTHNERAELINKLDELISILDEQNDEELDKAKRKIESVKDELKDEEKPDKKSIFKWLSKAKEIFDAAKTAEKIYSDAKDVFDAFGVTS